MHTYVCSNQSILPLVIVESCNLSLYSTFALQQGKFTVTQHKQCACCTRSKQNLYLYTSFFELILHFLNSEFFLFFPLEACVESLRLLFIVCLVISLLLRDILL